MKGSRLTATFAMIATGAVIALTLVTPGAQAAAPVGGDVVSNGGFEANLWQSNESGTATVVSEQAHDGTYAIKASGRTSTGSGPMQRLGGKMSAGTTYSLSYWIYYDGVNAPATKSFWATAKYASAQKDEYGPYNLHVNLVQAASVPKGTWTQATGTFTIPADREDTSVFNLFFETPWTSSPTADTDLLDFYVDDVVLTEQGATRNLVAGGDFENVDTAPWAPRGGSTTITRSTDQFATGTGSLLVANRGGAHHGVTQSVPVESGATYDVSFKVKYIDPAAPATLRFQGSVDFGSAVGGSQYVTVLGADATRDTWSTISGGVTVPEGRDLSTYQFYIENVYGSASYPSFYLDDVTFVKTSGGSGETANTILSADFEDGVQGFTARDSQGTPTVDVTTDEFHGGAQALLVSNRTGQGDGAGYDFTGDFVVGQTYDISAWVKMANGVTADSIWLTAHTTNDGTDTFSTIGQFANVGADGWTQVTATYTMPDVDTVFLYFETSYSTGSNGDFLIDDVTFVKTSGGSGEPETPADPLESHNTETGSFGAYAKTVGRSNPLVTQNFGADPWAMEYDGRLYVYSTNDTQEWNDYLTKGEDNNYGSINQINVWSSADMVNWTNHGSINAAGSSGIATGASNSWAPAATHKTINGQEKFFLYFANSAGGIWVLEGDSPVGPWTSPRNDALVGWTTPGVRGLEGATDVVWLFDPAVLFDDDGQAYLYFGGGVPTGQADDPETARVIRLGEDMISTVGSAELVDAPGVFEDSGIHKFNGKYYYSYCTNFTTNLSIGRGNIAYMEADSPMGPWTESTFQGLAFQNQNAFFGVGGNNHHAIFQFKGEWYLIYHAQTLDKALTGGGNGFRSAHIDKIEIAEDGTITPVIGTYAGIPQLQTMDAYEEPISAETIAWQSGTRQGYAGGSSFANEVPAVELTSVHDADWTSLSDVDFGNGASAVAARVQGLAGGSIAVRTAPDQTDDSNIVATLEVPAGDGNSWTTVSADLAAGALTGVSDVYFTYSGEGDDALFDVDTWAFSEREPQQGTIATKVRAKAKPTAVVAGTPSVIEVAVAAHKKAEATEVPPSGSVTVRVGGQDYVGTLDAGEVDVTVQTEGLDVGVHTVEVIYGGDASYAEGTTSAKLVVVPTKGRAPTFE